MHPQQVQGRMLVMARQRALEERLTLDVFTSLLNHQGMAQKRQGLLAQGVGGFFFSIERDDFKKINDTWGHGVGDALLREVAAELRGVFDQGALTSRMGGDEFAAFMTGTVEWGQAAPKARRLLADLGRINPGSQGLCASIGIAQAPRDGASFQALYQAADEAMYRAKAQGKNRFCFAEASPVKGLEG